MYVGVTNKSALCLVYLSDMFSRYTEFVFLCTVYTRESQLKTLKIKTQSYCNI